MTKLPSHFRSAVAAIFGCAAVLLFSATQLRADNITYNFVDYPLDENGHQLSGSITLGGLSIQDFVSGSFIIDGTTYPIEPWTSYWGTSSPIEIWGSAPIVTSTQILVPHGCCLRLNAPWGPVGGYGVRGTQFLEYDYGANYGDPNPIYDSTYAEMDGEQPSSWWEEPVPNASGYLGANPTWVIATTQPVPEPASITLLVSALLGLVGASCLRRRGVKA